jgi:hypothetical protein
VHALNCRALHAPAITAVPLVFHHAAARRLAAAWRDKLK